MAGSQRGDVKVVHLIVGLGKGGAETSLVRTLTHVPQKPDRVVTMLAGDQFYVDAVRQLGIPLVRLDFKRRPVRALMGLAREARDADTVCCWMYAACVAGWLVTRGRGQRVVWMIRHTDLSVERNRLHTVVMARMMALVSGTVAAVTFNGERSLQAHRAIGFHRENAVVLDNACDTDRFRPRPEARSEIDRELELAPGAKVILSVGRWNPLKDVPLFLRALAHARATEPRLVGIMCGQGLDASNSELVALAQEAGLVVGETLHLLGPGRDVAQLYAACDVFALHSRAEAFPNVLLEAMASEASCVATDVGDVARIAKDSDVVVIPPSHVAALSEALVALGSRSGAEAALGGALNRDVVEERFPLDVVVRNYESVITGR